MAPRTVGTSHHDDATDSPIDTTIRRLESELGIHTDAERALEARLLIDRKFLDIALVSRQPRPETLFGKAEWAGHLEARLAARKYLAAGDDGRPPLTVDFMIELHRRLAAHTDNRDSGGVLTDGRGKGWGVPKKPLTDDEIAAIEDNPLLSYAPPPFRVGEYGLVMEPRQAGEEGARWFRELHAPLTDSEKTAIDRDPLSWFAEGPIKLEHGVIFYPRFRDFRAELQSVADWYNDTTSRPGYYDPYGVAAELQRRLVATHPFLTDYNGRWSRELMNLSLERDGLSPSAHDDFDKDLYSRLPDYTEHIREGSHQYERWRGRIASNPEADSVTAFELEHKRRIYLELDGRPAPFTPGKTHDAVYYEQLPAQLNR